MYAVFFGGILHLMVKGVGRYVAIKQLVLIPLGLRRI